MQTYGVLTNPLLNRLLEKVCESIQLTESQDADARLHYGAVSDWLGAVGSPLSQYKIHIFPQGSQNLGTTTKPVNRQEFDLDAVCLIDGANTNHPGELYSLVWDRLRDNRMYRDRIERFPRCVRVNYAGNFHLDIVPAIIDPTKLGNFILVPELDADLSLDDPKNNRWKTSNPRDYAEWFDRRCTVYESLVERYAKAHVDPIPDREAAHRKAPLKRVVQLLKRWRDVEYQDRPQLSPPSIILTTLASQFYQGDPSCGDSLGIISVEVNNWLRECRPVTLRNPANSDEEICEKWQRNRKAHSDFCETFGEFESAWSRLTTLRGPMLYDELKRLFDDGPVENAIKSLSENSVGKSRLANMLHAVPSSTGMLYGTPSVRPSHSLPIRKNNFFGE